MSSPDLALAPPSGPPKKGSGPRPTMSQMFTAPKVQIQETKTVPLIDLQKLEADVTLLEAKKKAEQKKKAAAVVIPKSVPSVELKISEVAPVASLASSAVDLPKPAPAAEAKPSSFLPNLFGTAEPEVSTKSEVAKSEDAVKVVSQQAKLDAFLDDEGPAQENALMKSEKPVDDKAFLDLKAAVETKVGATPIRVTPREKIFMPATRRSIHQFVIETYSSYILKKPNPDLVGDACKELSRVSAATVENFKYQEFVRDYMQKGSPYRGLLVYHGLGSGKTCTSIAAEEALRFGGMRKIFILTPASLSGNYKKELALCGYYAFKKDNNWEKVEVPLLGKYGDEKEEIDTASSQFAFLTDTYGLSADYILNKWRNYKLRSFWVANPSGAVNFGSFSAEEQKDIEKQIDAHMSTRFEFIKYNGLREKKIREWICGSERAEGGSGVSSAATRGGQPKNIFDGAVVVIDEVHNIVRGIVGSNLEQFFKVEPRQPNYVGTFCGTPRKYRIMYGLYRLLCNAVGCKIIALSGTPIINKPHEIGVLSNILAGDRRVARISLNPAVNTSALENLMKRQPEVDFYKYEQVKEGDNAYLQLTISPVPSGFTKVVDEATGVLKGFMRMEEREDEEQMARERNLEEWFARVAPAIGASNIVGEPRFEALPQLPDTEKEFIESFVDRKQLKIMNPISLKSRLTGLISYYKGSKKELVARVTTDEVVYLDMSEWQLSKYQALRKDEIETETDTKKPEGGQTVGGLAILYGDAYAQATKSVNSSFKIFSRAACNFVFPDGISRPTPKDSKKAAALLGVRDEGGEKGDEGESEEHELAAAQVVEESHDTRAAKLEGFLSEEDTKEEEEQRAVAKQATALLDREITQASMEYGEQVQASLDALRARAAEIFVPEKLSEYSPKYAAILEKVRQSKGPALIYSNFKTLEGLGIFGIACEYQTNPGYVRLDIKKEGTEWVLADALKAPENKGKERFILYSGDDAQDKREILRDIFNWDIKKLPASLKKDLRWLAGGQPNNFTGKICRMFMITQSGAEGISLKNVRQVHIMEPFWNYVRLEQVQGRAIRICSHKDLPLAERTVDVFTYLMRFSEVAKRDRKVDESIFVRDKGMTTDEIIYTLMLTKRKLNEQMFEIMKDSAIDCMLNALEHGSKSCFVIRSGGPLFLYDPDYRVDIAASSSTFRTTDAEVVPQLTSSGAPQTFEKEVAEPSEASLPPGLSGAAETRVPAEAQEVLTTSEEAQPQLNAVEESAAEAESNAEEALEANAAAQEAQQQEGLNKPI
uniref:Helicase C-terminal domain-containing protein n=1 Tax=viral metagenome TaxID=1070528 RepID=A0A6C0BIF0_9ZZZZ